RGREWAGQPSDRCPAARPPLPAPWIPAADSAAARRSLRRGRSRLVRPSSLLRRESGCRPC
ncbi:hypothetical protein PMAYCL1PPCAC_03494, partial [Pristionchus mayeri]